MTPSFGIGQRALLIITLEGNMLWDCINLIDDTTADIVDALGGLRAIGISHPHYYTSMIGCSQTFDNAPIYLHQRDRQWVQRPHENINYCNKASLDLFGGITLYNTGGHFEGGTILHWPDGAEGQGALLTGDILQVVPDHRHISFMYSYPNHIPLNARAIDDITGVLKPLSYDRIYGAWWDQNILNGGKSAVRRSAKRYIKAIT